MVLNIVNLFHKVVIKNTGLNQTPSKMVNFHEQRAITLESMVGYGRFSNLRRHVQNNVTKFHKILTKTIQLRERRSFQTVNFHKQRAITHEGVV